MGFIYLLYNEKGQGYIGQTRREDIRRRISLHKTPKNMSSSKKLGDFEWLILEEVENDYLNDYEQYYYDMYYDMFGDKIINKKRPFNTREEYYDQNKEYIKKKSLDYYIKNREKNREKKLSYQKEYKLKIKSLKNIKNVSISTQSNCSKG